MKKQPFSGSFASLKAAVFSALISTEEKTPASSRREHTGVVIGNKTEQEQRRSVAVENFGAAETVTVLFLFNVLREDISEFLDVLDIFDFKNRAGLILRTDFNGAKAENLLTEGTLYADILHSVKENFFLIGAEEAFFVDEILRGDGICGERKGESKECTSLTLLDQKSKA